MKNFKLTLVILLICVAVWSCKNETEPEIKIIKTSESLINTKMDNDKILAKAEFNIEGMTCAIGCAKTIEKKLAKMDGVKYAKVDFEKKLAQVEYDESIVNTVSLENTVTKASDSYSVNDMKTVDFFSNETVKNGNALKKESCKKGCEKDCCADKGKES
ncbi:MAG: heavy-metal-associated domain-containing protein [Flavobacteriaceae bacterium]|nr:heavy-metal-associated domain-containing protein [Flavobacteriaceae bacterium]